MAAQTVASRSNRPNGPVDIDDPLVARAVEFSAWMRRNAKVVIGLAALAFLLLAGFVYYRWDQAQREERAAQAFVQLEGTLASGNEQLAAKDLGDFVRRFEGTPYAEEARLALARLHMEGGRPQEAVQVLEGAAGRIGRANYGVQAALLLGAAQEAAGNRDAAIATFLKVADEAELRYAKVEALSTAATLREQAGDFAGAAELYGRTAALFEEGDADRSFFEMRRAEAEARATQR